MNGSDVHLDQNENGRRLLILAGLAMFGVASWFAGAPNSLWLAPLGFGVVLTAWLGYRLLPLWGICHFVVLQFFVPSNRTWEFHFVFSILITVEIGAVWFLYSRAVRTNRRLDDPHNATVFLIWTVVVAAVFAFLSVLLTEWLLRSVDWFWYSAGRSWLSHMLGILVLGPLVLVVLGPYLQRWRIIADEPEDLERHDPIETRWTLGEVLETASLTIAASCLAVAMALDTEQGEANQRWWAVLLMVIVWASLRLRLRGGLLTACLSALLALAVASAFGRGSFSAVFQGYLLTQCTTALLVGVSSNWIRASEDRFRQLMGHLPVVLYSVRLIKPLPKPNSPKEKNGADRDDPMQRFWTLGRVTLASAGVKDLLGCRPEDLMGPLEKWKQRIEPADLEVVQAAFLELSRAERPITFEYRIIRPADEANPDAETASVRTGDDFEDAAIWVRDTLVPHYSEDGEFDGWDGVLQNITESRRLAHQLRRTSGMFQALIENLPAGVFFVKGPEGRPILVNARARQLLGRREDLAASCQHLSRVYRLHRSDGNIYPFDELPVTKALFNGLTGMADDVVVHRSDGRKVPLITWAAPVDLGGKGQPDAAVWVLEDLTALHQAEFGRRDSEARLRAVIETMAEGVVVLDNRRKIIELNPAAQEIFGNTMRLGKFLAEVEDVFCWEDGSPAPTAELPMATVFETHQQVRNVVLGLRNKRAEQNRQPEGDIARWMVVDAIPLPAIRSFSVKSGEARVVATVADVTDYRRAMDDLRNAKNKYQNLIESLPLSVLQFDSDMRLTFANPAAHAFLGYGPDEAFAPDFVFRMLHEDCRPQFQKALEGNAKSPVRIQITAKDGSLKSGLAFLQPRSRSNGDGIDCLIVDMTKQRMLEKEVEKAQRLELVGKLAGGTIHDFNNLLTAMIGSASLAQMGLPSDHPACADLQRILDAGEQASHLAGQLLAFSKNQHLRVAHVEISETLRHTANMIRSMMPRRDTIQLELRGGPFFATADENALKQVVMNLCLNARDAISENGTIRVTCGRSRLPASFREQETRNRDGDAALLEWIYFAIEDNGSGIPEEVQTKLFEPFFSTKERGTGLGLAIVQQIIDQFHGHIEVESELGRGTRFCVWLPPVRTD